VPSGHTAQALPSYGSTAYARGWIGAWFLSPPHGEQEGAAGPRLIDVARARAGSALQVADRRARRSGLTKGGVHMQTVGCQWPSVSPQLRPELGSGF
jgi:hypothetical protein